jgi:hypothetical protein
VSIVHAYDEVFDRGVSVSARSSLAAIRSALTVIAERAACLFANIQHVWTMQRIARFSTHRLQDIGFERDWDGSLIQASGGAVAICSRY